MKFTRSEGVTGGGAAAIATVFAVSLMSGAIPVAAEHDRDATLHIVKDCAMESGVAGSDYCEIVSSNVPELPRGTRIYYDLSPGPTAGAAGFSDTNIFIFVSDSRWAVGRCTVPNDIFSDRKRGLCTVSDGVGKLAGFTARIVVAYTPGGSG
jgi:hypothetical protein